MNNHDSRTVSDRDNVTRLKNVAFWLWQYQARNVQYELYTNCILKHIKMFREMGELHIFMANPDKTEKLSSVDGEPITISNSPVTRYFEEKHGKAGRSLFVRFHYLIKSFYRRFGRHAKAANERIDSHDCLNRLFSGEEITFQTDNKADIAALLRMYNDWHIKSPGGNPNQDPESSLEPNTLTIQGNSFVEHSEAIGLEAHAISLFHKAGMDFWEEHNISSEAMKALYKLCLSGDRIKNTDIWRLCSLWMWDKAHEKDRNKPQAFETVYYALKDQIEGAILEDGVLEQIFTRKNRARKAYETTDRCIREMIVLPLRF